MDGLIQTGISGLDAMLYGGIPVRNQVLLSAGAGAGKTLLSFEYAARNAIAGKTCIFFSVEEEKEMIVGNAKLAFKDLAKQIDGVIESGKLIVNTDLAKELSTLGKLDYDFGDVISHIESTIVSTGATCVVIDSLSVFEVMLKEPPVYRRYVLSLIFNMRRLGVTSIMTVEMDSPDRADLRFRPESFVFDGVVVMYQTGEESKRMLALEVLKMRGAKHSFVTAPYEITPSGFKVFAVEEIVPD